MRIFIESRSSVQLFALNALIRTRPGWEVAGNAKDAADGIRQARGLKPDLILLDLGREEPWDGQVRALRGASPDSFLVILGTDPDLEREVLESGADLFFHKVNSPETLVSLLEGLQSGKPG